MALLVVNCTNRPKDEIIDCGTFGMRLNMHSYEEPTLDENLVLGLPLDKGKKLPLYGEQPKAGQQTKDEQPTDEGGDK